MRFISTGAGDATYMAHASTVLKRLGRAHLPHFLDEAAALKLYEASKSLEWWIAFRDGKAAVEGHLADFEKLDPDKRRDVMRRITQQAATEFQYIYDKSNISAAIEEGKACDAAMRGCYDAFNSAPFLEYLKKLTGEPRIAYVDAQATRYRPGQFLTLHHDEVEGAERLYAYVLNLTPTWKPQFGGQLMFVAPDGHISEAYTPCWNAFNIFKVPQPHMVGMVTPFAPMSGRISITGWIRADKPPIAPVSGA